MFEQLLAGQQHWLPPLSCGQLTQLASHFELLLKWNKVVNLSAVRNPEEIIERHYCESLFLAARLEKGTTTIADLGSGAGFPGVPLAICRPDCSVTLIEAHQRKAVFLREATRSLSNCRILGVRSDTVQEEFDCVVSRAVNLEEIAEDLRRMGRAVALLTGSDVAPAIECFTWNTAIQVPWGEHRHLHLGQRCFT